MRQSKKTNAGIDLTKPLPPTLEVYTDPEDCFGKEWDPLHRECSICSECDLCGAMFDKDVQKKVKAVEKEEQFLDTTDFDLVKWDALLVDIEGKNVMDIFESVQKQARTPDEVAVKNKLVEFLTDNGLSTKGGVIYRK